MELNDFFGWDSIAFVSDSQRQLHSDLPLYTTPNAPALTDIQYDNEQGLYTLSWETPAVQKGELAGYLVYVSEESRGWDWNTFYGDKSLLSYRSREGYRPEEILFKSQLPPSEVALLPLGWEATTVDIPIAQGQTLYVSLVAFDAHGQQVGNQLYPPSNEFVLTA